MLCCLSPGHHITADRAVRRFSGGLGVLFGVVLFARCVAGTQDRLLNLHVQLSSIS